MKIIKLDQEQDRESWLDFRRGKITGTKLKNIKPLTRGTDRTPQGFWELLAEKVSIAPDGENVMDRGLRLQEEAISRTAKKYKLKLANPTGVWVADFCDEITVSPDAYEDSDKPTFAIEVKCLNTANHLKYIINYDRYENKIANIDLIPKDNRDQVFQYFVVNENLEKLYFTFYDDRVALDKYISRTIIIDRDDIGQEIQDLQEMQISTITQINELLEEMKGKENDNLQSL